MHSHVEACSGETVSAIRSYEKTKSLEITPATMHQTIRVLLLCLINLGFLELTPAQLSSENVASIIWSFNQLENKLERHEHRERALGEVIKKSLQTLQRGQTNLQQLYGSQTSLDERINRIEIQLKTQGDRSMSRIENFFTEQKENNQQLLEKITKMSQNVEKLLYNSNYVVKPSNVAQNSNPYTASANFLEYGNHKTLKVDDIASTQDKPQEGLTYADKEFIRGLASETQNRVESVYTHMQNIVQRTQAETAVSDKAVDPSLYTDIDTILRRFNAQEDLMQRMYNQMNSSCFKVNDRVENLSSCSSISPPLTQVMDSEASINNVIDKQHEQLLDFMKTRFDTVDKDITNVQLEIAKNLNATIQNEASYLWRQISITNGEINTSKDLLRLMRDRNDIYVNSVLQSMAAMSNKVEDIKERVMDMNDNQTFLLNKLPLMPQEFSNVQQAFIGWLEQLSETLKMLQEKKKVPTS
ncbi:uncharacterized protein LOC105217268 isoform X1 [Zeugodacus cucurbitae]|uniref:uncharacterized protein LOC105217268 isoform X1 n=2 Tax=Zeugodacus cucurbitae TaxID=28588 RepID=UPI0023D9119F|nr:uncharacterized protein LOC105217268 isoform X1 [Zeugodacus cucurbitae]